MDRKEHLDWCKQRALEYVNAGQLDQAFASMTSDLRKHDETAKHGGCELGVMLMLGGFLNNAHEMRKWIEGFN